MLKTSENVVFLCVKMGMQRFLFIGKRTKNVSDPKGYPTWLGKKSGVWVINFGSWVMGFGFWVIDIGFWVMRTQCDVMHDVKDILGHGSWILDYGSWIPN